MNIDNTKASDIKTREDVKALLYHLIKVEEFGYGFHPDTPFNDYINSETKEYCYSDEEAHKRNELLDHCVELISEDGIYEILEEINPLSELFGE